MCVHRTWTLQSHQIPRKNKIAPATIAGASNFLSVFSVLSVVTTGYSTNVPFVDGTAPAARSSTATACRNAFASALNIASAT